MDLMIVNPSSPGRSRFMRRRRPGTVRVKRMGPLSATRRNAKKKVTRKKATKKKATKKKKTVSRKKPVSRKKNPARKKAAASKGKKTMAAKKKTRRVKRRNVKHKAKRSRASYVKAGKKAAATKKRKATVRKKAGKKAAATRKRKKTRKNPPKRAKKRVVKRRASRRKTVKRKVTRRRRRNPNGPSVDQLKRQLRAQGLKTTGKKSTLRSRLYGVQTRAVATGARKKKRSTSKAARARRTTGKYTSAARATLKRSKSRQRKTVARAYLKARGVAKRAKRGTLSEGAKKMATAYGLTRINPGLKGVVESWKVMLPLGAAGGVGLIGGLWAGQQITSQLAKVEMLQKLPQPVKTLLPGLATLTVTGLVYGLMRKTKGKTLGVDLGRLAGPVMIGGTAAAILMVLMKTRTGQKIMAKMGVSIAVVPPQATPGGAEVVAKAAANGKPPNGLGAYIRVSQYLGDYVDAGPQEAFGAYQTQDVSAMGPSWYGRRDMLMGNYEVSDFPVHSPGPGDNISVHAALGDAYGQEGIFDVGAAFPPGGYGPLGQSADVDSPYELEQTPGGTLITMGEAGIFGGKTAIG